MGCNWSTKRWQFLPVILVKTSRTMMVIKSRGFYRRVYEKSTLMCSFYFINSELLVTSLGFVGEKKTKQNKNTFISCSVQLLSRIWLFGTPWTAAPQASLPITNSQSLPKLMSIESVMPSNHLILCHPLLLLPSIFPNIRVFSNESALLIMWPKYWSFSFNISPSNKHPGLISFRMDWLDLLAVQGTLKSLL